MNKQNKFKIVIPSYNNEKWASQNAASIINQTYKNYDVLYLNDASTDKTLEIVQGIKKSYNLDNWKIINWKTNKQRGFNVNPNSNHIIEFMDNDSDILMFVDGDDWLIDEHVLQKLNDYYNEHSPWMTYGGMYCWPSSEKAHPQNSQYSELTHKNKAYRQDVWRASHLRSFKWFLYKEINREDLIWSKTGEYYYNAEDLAVSFYCMEMCPSNKIGVVDFPTYAYNEDPDIVARGLARQDKDIENPQGQEAEIRAKIPYKTLAHDIPEPMYSIVPTLAGGLGNMMFQIAAATGLSTEKHKVVSNFAHVGTQHRLPTAYEKNIFRNIPKLQSDLKTQVVTVDSFTHQPGVLPMSDVLLNGYYQSPKYFEHARDSIVELFSPTEEIKEYISKKYGNLKGFVSIHVRRGDYTNLSEHHHNLDLKYYLNAIDYFMGYKFMVFSDDIDWCKENFNFSSESIFVEGEEDYVDLYLMSSCEHNIIANSTFSWWAAYLNKNPEKKVIYPDKWFGPKNSQFSTQDLFPNDWICLSENLPQKIVNLFNNSCAHLARENGRYSTVHGKISKHLKFLSNKTDHTGINLFVDENLYMNMDVPGQKIGWLMETREVCPSIYHNFESYKNNYDFILTHDPELLSKYPNDTVIVPFGGCWIKDSNFRRADKTKNVSMIYSDKTLYEGHKLRHAVAKKIANIDLYGKGSNNPVDIKEASLIDYRFSIVIENSNCKNYFTEKLIDCLAVGTIPIYWGCPNIGEFFDLNGIITFNTIDELINIMSNLNFNEQYSKMLPAITKNIEIAKKYNITEDWIYENYKEKFVW